MLYSGNLVARLGSMKNKSQEDTRSPEVSSSSFSLEFLHSSDKSHSNCKSDNWRCRLCLESNIDFVYEDYLTRKEGGYFA